MNVELRHLRAFLAVADELHFGRAADALRIAQPALSQQIQRLEAELGTTLFTRTSRSVALTAAGTVLQARARALVRQSDRDLDEVARVGRGELGRLDVGFVSSALPLGPIERVQRFRAAWPGVEIVVHEGYTSALLGRLARGELDVATVRDPDPHEGVITEPFVSEPFAAVLPAGDRRASRSSIAGAELADDPFVFFPRSAGERAHDLNLSPVTDAGGRVRITQEASSWPTIIHFVGAGLGVTIAPRSATLSPPVSVVVLPLEGTTARSSLHLATRVGDDRAVVRNFRSV
ncbi:LysR substrate-binding domain-containing protein [Frigoribacterium sp. 2-23]|uniref:LysR substrate-binding domain-containing protein n=1 Tax=Frigoribacterium sp. 2-23 TaxID=3415006 RepID=UPI003C6F5FB8